jgi:cytochrome b561
LRNGPAGYGAVTKTLHWLTVLAVTAQFSIGYGLDAFSGWIAGTDDSDADEAGVFAHAALGVTILLLAVIRLGWRWATPLPPWGEQLTERDRRLASLTERVLYLTLFWIPLSGIGLLFLSGEERDVAENNEWQPPYDVFSDDVALAAHVAGHVLFYTAVIFHVGLALRRRTVSRML